MRLEGNSHTYIHYARLKGRGGSVFNAGSESLLPLRLISNTSKLNKVFKGFLGTFGLRHYNLRLQTHVKFHYSQVGCIEVTEATRFARFLQGSLSTSIFYDRDQRAVQVI